tara:strand:- start:37 stop:312 length:276 start_codon:yes stop_codon:yes gene_type:complete
MIPDPQKTVDGKYKRAIFIALHEFGYLSIRKVYNFQTHEYIKADNKIVVDRNPPKPNIANRELILITVKVLSSFNMYIGGKSFTSRKKVLI